MRTISKELIKGTIN